MKTNRYIITALAILAATACQDKLNNPAEVATFHATIENPAPEIGSRTILGEAYTGSDDKTHYPVMWYGVEKITVFDTDGTNYQFDGYARNADKEPIRMETVNFKNKSMTLVEGDTYYAVDPYYSSHKIDGTKITVSAIANNQYVNTAAGNMPCRNAEYEDQVAVALAKTTDTYLTFKPVTALIKFTMGIEGVTEIVFKDNVSGNAIAGSNIEFDFSGDSPVYSTIGTSKTTIYLRIDSASTPFEVGETYYIAVLPKTIAQPRIGYKKTGASGYTYLKGSEQMVLAPGMILNLGTIQVPQQ